MEQKYLENFSRTMHIICSTQITKTRNWKWLRAPSCESCNRRWSICFTSVTFEWSELACTVHVCTLTAMRLNISAWKILIRLPRVKLASAREPRLRCIVLAIASMRACTRTRRLVRWPSTRVWSSTSRGAAFARVPPERLECKFIGKVRENKKRRGKNGYICFMSDQSRALLLIREHWNYQSSISFCIIIKELGKMLI